VYVQIQAGHSQSQITEHHIHAAQVLFPRAAAKGEARMFVPTDQPTGEPDSLTPWLVLGAAPWRARLHLQGMLPGRPSIVNEANMTGRRGA
jgi:hypothetical protein